MSLLARAPLFMAGAAGGAAAIGLARSNNRRTVRDMFRHWVAGQGSLNDLMDDATVIEIPGTLPHCGTFSRSAFMNEVAVPFMARFSRPPAPKARKIWSRGSEVVVLAEADGIRRDGKPYANTYVFVLRLRRGRVVRATEFLDMAAFNEVWDQVEPATVLSAGAEIRA